MGLVTEKRALAGERIAYLFGADDHRGRAPAAAGVLSEGSTDLWRLRGGDGEAFRRFHIPGNFRRLRAWPSLDGVDVVLNLITDPDLNPDVLKYADQRLRGYDGRVINRPGDVLQSARDDIAGLLSNIDGLIVPRVVRFRGHPNLARRATESAGLRFPAILREIGKHNGDIVGVVANHDELSDRINPKATYFLTEFVEARGPDGLYHKIRLFFFGPYPLVRHRVVSDHWNVHGPDRERVLLHHPAQIAEERRLVEEGQGAFPDAVWAVLRAVRDRVPLDYFGIDFALMPDGRVLLFEANATMNFFSLHVEAPFEYFGRMLPDAQEKFMAMLAGRHVATSMEQVPAFNVPDFSIGR